MDFPNLKLIDQMCRQSFIPELHVKALINLSIFVLVVFDDGDIATLKRTQICLKGDKHFMESDTLDRLPLTNPEHFSTPVNLLKPSSRRRRAGMHSSPRYDVM
mgnify:CR=1 FL=1